MKILNHITQTTMSFVNSTKIFSSQNTRIAIIAIGVFALIAVSYLTFFRNYLRNKPTKPACLDNSSPRPSKALSPIQARADTHLRTTSVQPFQLESETSLPASSEASKVKSRPKPVKFITRIKKVSADEFDEFPEITPESENHHEDIKKDDTPFVIKTPYHYSPLPSPVSSPLSNYPECLQ